MMYEWRDKQSRKRYESDRYVVCPDGPPLMPLSVRLNGWNVDGFRKVRCRRHSHSSGSDRDRWKELSRYFFALSAPYQLSDFEAVTPKSCDRSPAIAKAKPSLAKPRFSNPALRQRGWASAGHD
jgi:hypothetical protein